MDIVYDSYPKVDYHIVDTDVNIVKRIKQRFPFVSAHVTQDVRELKPFPDGFDVIIGVDVWEHLPPELLIPYTRWCYQHLNPGGVLILQVPNWGCPLTPSTFFGDLTHVNCFNEKSIRQLFRIVGIDDADFSVQSRKTPGLLGFFRDTILWVCGLCLRMLYILFGSVRLRLFAPDVVAIAEKPEGKVV